MHVYAVSSCNELLWYGIMDMWKAEAEIDGESRVKLLSSW